MKKITALILTLAAAAASAVDTAKPGTRWWIFGNSFDKASLTCQLEYMKSAGIGGVSVACVDGQKGDEANYVEYLSPKFMEMMSHICKEARRLDMIVDFTMGCGWPFGGPWITEKYTTKKLGADLKCVSANFKVKRAAPGGEGLTANPFNPEAYRLHCAVFKDAFRNFDDQKALRGFFNDSYEYEMADWTENFLEEFKKRRGYDFEPFMKDVFGKNSKMEKSDIERLWQDYHETLSDLLYDTMLEYANACADMGYKCINQAHGSAGNVIDLYAIADIPETESFGASVFDIPNVRVDPDYQEWRFGRPDKTVMKFAASAANLRGAKLVSSESCTWLANHFMATLAQMKPEIDKLFYGGINHVFYHGMPYTPKDEPFPGRMFYASVNYNQNAPYGEFFGLLNEYIRASQSVLQNTKGDNDILLYFPIHAFWKESGEGRYNALCFNVHRTGVWLRRSPNYGNLLASLEAGGFCYDYVSDALLKEAKVENGLIKYGDKYYKVILIPNVGQLPIATYKSLDKIIEAGGRVVFDGAVPSDVAGYHKAAERAAEAGKIAAKWRAKANVSSGDPLPRLLKFGVKRERMADLGLEFIRKTGENGIVYFIANQTQKFARGKVNISAGAAQIEFYSPVYGRRGALKFAPKNGGSEFELELLPGQSCFIFANKTPKSGLKEIAFAKDGNATEIDGKWEVEFLRALPTPIPDAEMPQKKTIDKLKSWTEFGDENASKFCGIARYKTTFKVADASKNMALDLGDVRDNARVFVNGKLVGNLWCAPFRAAVPAEILKPENVLEIEVSNGAFNRAKAYLDANPQWFKTHWLYDITYTKYNTQKKPFVKSGLLGPVRLIEK